MALLEEITCLFALHLPLFPPHLLPPLAPAWAESSVCTIMWQTWLISSQQCFPLSTGCSVISHWPLASRVSPILTSVSFLSFTLSPCHAVTSRCPSLSLWLCPTQNRCSWSTVRTPPHQPVQQAPRLPGGLQGALPPGQSTRVRTRGWPFYQRIQRQAETSSTWSREWPVSFTQLSMLHRKHMQNMTCTQEEW